MRILVLSDLFLGNPTFRTILGRLGEIYERRGHRVTLAGPLSPRRARPYSTRGVAGRVEPLEGTSARSLARTRVLLGETDAVHLHLNGYWPDLRAFLGPLVSGRTPVVVSFHNYAQDGLPAVPRRAETSGFSGLLLRCAAVTTLSRFGRSLILERLPALKGRIRVVPEGCDPALRPSREEPARPYVLCPARLVFDKGIDLLLAAWAGLETPCRLLLAGEDFTEGACLRLARRLGLAGRVEFLGHVERPRLLGLMARSRLVVLPSRHEFFGMAALEAMSLGKAVVASATGPADFIRHRRTGWLVPPGTVEPLREALSSLLEDAGLRRRLGGAARESSPRYAWEAVADSYLRLLTGSAAILS